MRRCIYGACLAVSLACSVHAADPAITIAPGAKLQPVPASASVRLSGPEFELLTLTGYAGPVTWDASGDAVKLFELKGKESVIGIRAGAGVPDRHESPDTPTVAVFAVNTGNVTIAAWGVRDGKPVKLATFAVDANVGPRPPPDPKPPDPKPPDPKPVPVETFRVIFVYESGHTLTAAQNSVMNGAAMREYLGKVTTAESGWSGYRMFDKDATAANETPGIKALWTRAKPKIAAVPAMVVEINGKESIHPFPATVNEGIATLKKLRGDN